MDFYPANDRRLTYFAPQPVASDQELVRLERFPQEAYAALSGQIGPKANLRSSSGCAVWLRTDSPWVELHLAQLRHHQPGPVGVAAEVAQPDGGWMVADSTDLREFDDRLSLRLATGLERGEEPREVALWLPLISTCAVAGIGLALGSAFEAAVPPAPRWLAIGDSLCQGFCVQSPVQNWVHRLSRRWNLPVWNLGVGGLKIEPAVVAWALASRPWELVTIALGSNHSWHAADVDTAADLAQDLTELALASGGRRVVWLLPPYKPCEDGKGPPDFAGVPLGRETGARVTRVRDALRARLSELAPALELVEDLMPRDWRLLPDGLHPTAHGFAKFADNLAKAMAR